MKVSIVIPSWNRKEDLMRCLKSIRRLSYKDYEIVVVDNGSTEGTNEMLEKLDCVRLIRNYENLGAAMAKNQGINNSMGDFIWFLDSDAEILDKDCLTNMLEVMRDPKVGAVGGELVEAGGLKMKVHKPFINGDGKFVLFEKDYGSPVECEFLATANCLVRRDIIEKIGGFDIKYFYIFEDNDLGFRVKKLGYRNISHTKTSVLHNPSGTARISTFRLLHRNRVRFVLLNQNMFAVLLLPVIDLITSIYLLPSRIADLRSRQDDEISYLERKRSSGSGKESRNEKNSIQKVKQKSIITRVMGFAWLFMSSLVYAYLWNFLHLPDTIGTRLSGRRYI